MYALGMEESWHEKDSGFFGLLIQHPEMQDKVVDFTTSILAYALRDSEIRGEVLAAISESELVGLFEGSTSAQPDERSIESEKSMGRQKITARDAAQILRYNPHYFSRKAKSWGLTKIRMSRTSCRYYLDEVEQLAADRGIREEI